MSLSVTSGYGSYAANSAGNNYKNTNDYFKYLFGKYKCLTPCKSASVTIDSRVLKKAMSDSNTAEWLEENLALMPKMFEDTKKFVEQRGSKLISTSALFTDDGIEVIVCSISDTESPNEELDKWLEKLKEDSKARKKAKETEIDEKRADRIRQERLVEGAEDKWVDIGFDTYV